MDMLKDAIWNELKNTLYEWDMMNESIERNEARYTKSDHAKLRAKITDLEARLEACKDRVGA